MPPSRSRLLMTITFWLSAGTSSEIRYERIWSSGRKIGVLVRCGDGHGGHSSTSRASPKAAPGIKMTPVPFPVSMRDDLAAVHRQCPRHLRQHCTTGCRQQYRQVTQGCSRATWRRTIHSTSRSPRRDRRAMFWACTTAQSHTARRTMRVRQLFRGA